MTLTFCPHRHDDQSGIRFNNDPQRNQVRPRRRGALGMSLADIVNLIQGITPACFYKSMTSHTNHTIWQDVYHVPYEELILYVKFTTDPQGHLLISLREK